MSVIFPLYSPVELSIFTSQNNLLIDENWRYYHARLRQHIQVPFTELQFRIVVKIVVI